jgi:3-(3-hydroxy-phenyl)propionate hydroxylase
MPTEPTEECVSIAGPARSGFRPPRAGVTGVRIRAGTERESRASAFHPSPLDMLDDLGLVDGLMAIGLAAPRVQCRTRLAGVIAAFDFAGIADVSRHPYRLQNEQNNLTRIIEGKLKSNPNYRIEFGRRVCGARQDAGAARIAADGAHSEVRKVFDIAFEGFTCPARLLVIDTRWTSTPSSPASTR